MGRSDPDQIKEMIDTCDQELRALQRFECNTETWSPLIAVYMLRKLDRDTRREWEMTRNLNSQPALPELKSFLSRRILAIRNFKTNDHSAQERYRNDFNHTFNKRNSNQQQQDIYTKRRKNDQDQRNNLRKINPFVLNKPDISCPCCTSTNHRLWDCLKFEEMDHLERTKNVEKWKICVSCLSKRHSLDMCSWRGCKYCAGARHHRMLCPKYPVMNMTNHVRKTKRSSKNSFGQVMNIRTSIPLPQEKGVGYPSSEEDDDILPIIGTARFRLRQGINDNTGQIRAICDSGSQLNLITEDCIQRWRLKRSISTKQISGVGISAPIVSNGHIDCFMLHPKKSIEVIPIRFIVVSKISCQNPCQAFECPISNQLESDELADLTFATPGHIDALIGIDAWTSILRQGIIKSYCKKGRFVAQDTELGWVIAGSVKVERLTQGITPHAFHIINNDLKLDQLLERFWLIEETDDIIRRSYEEERAEQIFTNTHKRDENGRYIVAIPLKENCMRLGTSKQTALKRFIALESKFKKKAMRR